MSATLTQLRAGLHFSASALRTFLTCPMKFRFQYVQGAEPAFRPSSLLLGSAVHKALAAHHLAVQAARPIASADVQAAFEEALERETRPGGIPLQYREGEDPDSLRATGNGLIDVYLREAQLGTIVAVEQPFQANLADPRTGEVLDPKFVGVFDLVEVDEEGTVSIAEIKTAARRWSTGQVNLDLQGTLYVEAAVQSGLVPNNQEALIRYDVLVKNKKPVLDRQYAVRMPGDRQLAMGIAVDALQAIEREAFYRNPGWTCDGCPFRRACGV